MTLKEFNKGTWVLEIDENGRLWLTNTTTYNAGIVVDYSDDPLCPSPANDGSLVYLGENYAPKTWESILKEERKFFFFVNNYVYNRRVKKFFKKNKK